MALWVPHLFAYQPQSLVLGGRGVFSGFPSETPNNVDLKQIDSRIFLQQNELIWEQQTIANRDIGSNGNPCSNPENKGGKCGVILEERKIPERLLQTTSSLEKTGGSKLGFSSAEW